MRVQSPKSEVQSRKSKSDRPWTLDLGLWTLDLGLWTLDFGLWTLGFGLWTLMACAGDPSPEPKRAAALPVAELKRDVPVDFEREILPILKNNCLACHNQTKAKAGLNLEASQGILKGGDTGPAVSPGRSGDSLIFKAAAHLDPDLI